MSRAPAIPSHPTKYGGILFRSRLEARYAALWDLLGLHWEYENLELDSYVPDFLVDVALYPGPDKQPTMPTLIEVKPVWTPEEYETPISKIALSGWTGPAIVVGSTVRKRELFLAKPEYIIGYGHPTVTPKHALPGTREWFPVGWNDTGPAAGQFSFGGTADLTSLWREAGNEVQWRPR